MNISVYAHIHKDEEVLVELQEGDSGKYAAVRSGGLTVFINSREKALELASQLEQTAQKWVEGEK